MLSKLGRIAWLLRLLGVRVGNRYAIIARFQSRFPLSMVQSSAVVATCTCTV